MKLISPTKNGRIPELSNPNTFYEVLTDPAPLAGMAYPIDIPWDALWNAGYRHVLRLTGERRAYDPAPLSKLKSYEIQDLNGGMMPNDPVGEERRLREAVAFVIGALRNREGVVVHCDGGTGRTGTVIACTLRELGFERYEILSYLSEVGRKRTDHGSWPESDWQREQMQSWILVAAIQHKNH